MQRVIVDTNVPWNSQARCIISGNTRHLGRAELQFPGLRILDPAAFFTEAIR